MVTIAQNRRKGIGGTQAFYLQNQQMCYDIRMYILTVIPIQKGLQKEHLSYFSGTPVGLGMIVTIPVRLKEIDAIVIACEDARALKSDIKNADFQLKKIVGIRGSSPFNNAFFSACERMKDYTASSTGALIKLLLPTVFLEHITELHEHTQIQTETTSTTLPEKLIFQALLPDRLSFYRTLIREAFAKKESVFICVPTRYDIDAYTQALSKGIDQYVYAFESEMPKKKALASYNACIDEIHPILIIGTGMYLSIPRSDMKTIIVEHESSDAYKKVSRPYIDIRSFAEVLATHMKAKLIYGDTLLRPETLKRHEDGTLGEVASPLFRLPQAQRQIIIDMKEEVDEKGVKKWTVLSNTTKQMIAHALEHHESVFLFSVRKGLAGVTVCHDCGHTMLCPDCATPVVLYGAKQRTATKASTERVFMCNKCGKKETTETRCPSCQSWNLTPLGVGTDRVVEEVAKLFPQAPLIQIDREATPTDKDARIAIREFAKHPGSILVGTEMAFSYIQGQVTHSALISLDGLLSIPSFNITQNILHCIEKLHSMTDRNVIIQTRIPDNEILRHILGGNVLPLYREDLKERETYGYPPFKRLIKISFTGTAKDTEKARAYLDHILGGYDPQIFSAFVGKVRGEYVTNTVIKIDPKLWPLLPNERIPQDTHLKEALGRLPPAFSINIDPTDLL